MSTWTPPWYYQTNLDSSPTFETWIIVIILHVLKRIILGIFTIQEKCCKEDLDIKRAKVELYADMIIFAVNFLYEYVIWCARFNFLLHHKNDYTAYKTASGEYVWPGPLYDNATQEELEAHHCNFTIQELAGQHECGIGNFMYISADLISEGFEQFSVGLGLCILPLLQLYVIHMHFKRANRLKDEQQSKWKKLGEAILFTIVVQMIGSQQSCVLMVLSLLSANPYCAYFNTPPGLSSNATFCIYKYSGVAIPGGLPMLIVGLIFCKFCCHSDSSSSNDCSGIFKIISIIFVIFGGGLMLLWLIGGMFLGVWMQYGNYVTQKVFILSEVLTPSGFLTTSGLHFILELFASDKTGFIPLN